MSDNSRNPQAFVLDTPEPEREPPRQPRAITGITFEPEQDEGALIVMPPAVARPARFRWGALLASAVFTLVMAAAQKMTPKRRRPKSPAADWKACAAGFAAFGA